MSNDNSTYEKEPKPSRANRRTGSKATATALSLLLLAACASPSGKDAGPVDGGATRATQESPKPKPSPEALHLTEQAQMGAEALATKIFEKQQNTPAKYADSFPDNAGSPKTVYRILLPTGTEVNSWPVTLGVFATIGKDPFVVDKTGPEYVDSIRVSLSREEDGTYSNKTYYEFSMQKENGGWTIGNIVDPNAQLQNGEINHYSTANPGGSGNKFEPLRPEALASFLEVANQVVDGEIPFDGLPKLILPG